MKTRRNLILICLLGATLRALPIAGQAQSIYTTNNGTIAITQYAGSGGDVVIPNTVGTLPVITIAPNVIFQCSSITRVSARE